MAIAILSTLSKLSCVSCVFLAAAAAQAAPGADPELAAELFRRALAAKPPMQYRLLAEALERGSLEAGARIVECGAFTEVAHVDMRAKAVRAWRSSERVVAGMPARQIYGALLAAWVAQNHDELGAEQEQLWTAEAEQDLASGPLQHPLLRFAALVAYAKLGRGHEPKVKALVDGLHEQLIASAQSREPLVAASYLTFAARATNVAAKQAELYERCAELYRDGGDLANQGQALHNRAWALQKLAPRDWSLLAKLYGEAAEISRRAGNTRWAGMSMHMMAWCSDPRHNGKGSWDQAIETAAAALPLRVQAGDSKGAIDSARLHASLLRPSQGRTSNSRSLPQYNPKGSHAAIAEVWHNAAALLAKAGDRRGQARALHEQGLAVKDDALYGAGGGESARQRAAAVFEEAAKLSLRSGDDEWFARSLEQRAECLHQDDFELSVALLLQAAETWRRIGDTRAAVVHAATRRGLAKAPQTNAAKDAAAAYDVAARLFDRIGQNDAARECRQLETSLRPAARK